MSHAASIVGRVTDTETDFGVEGATVLLDLEPTGGEPDATATTGLFGYYKLEEVAGGTSFTINVSHPAYSDQEKNEALLGDDELRNLSFELSRADSAATILDVQVSVSAVNHGTPLEGVPVHAWRYSTSDATDPPILHSVRTDSNGNAHFRGFESGYFQFSVNEPTDTPLPFYESYPTPAGRTPLESLETDHALTALLKHIPQTLSIRVLGFDPVSETVTSLENAVVELTGLSPRDQQSMVVPPRTSITNEAGRVTFFDLPPIPWRAKVKLLGYDVYTEVITPTSGGALPAGDNNLTLVYQPRALALSLTAEGYNNVDWLFDNISVKLEGIPNTNTEGIMREENAPGNFTGELRHDERVFRNLIPGRYRATLSGQSDLVSFYPLPVFQGGGVIELTDDTNWDGAITTSDGIICQAAPVRIRGRIFAADDMVEKNGALMPRYLPKAMTGVRFGEVEGNVAINLLPEDNRFVEFDTDEDGYYSIQVLPTAYGISIPTAEDYWGDHIDWKNETNGTGINQGWPYPMTWPFPFPSQPPRGNAVWPALPLNLQSGHDYVIDIYLHKQLGVLQFFYNEDNSAPSRELLLLPSGNSPSVREISLYSDLATPDAEGRTATATATPDGGGEPITGRFQTQRRVTIENLPSGGYTLSATHPRFSFTSQHYTVPDWPAPGILPISSPAPLGANINLPLHPTDPAPNNPLEATYNPSASSLSITFQVWSEGSGAYSNTGARGFDATSFVELPYLDNTLFDAESRNTPVGPFRFWIPVNGGYWEDTIQTEGEVKNIDLFVGGPSNTTPNSAGPGMTFRVIPKAVYAADANLVIPGATFRANGIENPADGTAVTVTSELNTLGGISAPTGWIKEDENTIFSGIDGTLVTVEVTATYTKQMTVAVTLKDAISDTPITEAAVRIRPSQGGRLTTNGSPNVALKHEDDGVYGVADSTVLPTLRGQECLVEVEAPGYKPYAKRVVPDGTPTPAVLTLDASLERLPLPSITSAWLNRNGLFLPGIQLTGDESAFDDPPPPEMDPLLVTWTVGGTHPAPFTVTTDTVDGDPAAAPDGTVTRNLTDVVATLYLIDSRAYDGNPSDPEVTVIPSRADDPDSPASVRGWIRRVEDGTLAQVVNQRVNLPAPDNPANPFEAGGMLSLPDLPPGDFEPGFVALTARGAAFFKEFPDYPGDRGIYRLKGAPLPSWLSFATNVLTAMTVTDANLAQAADFVPFGDYTPLGNFTTEVTLDAESPTFLDYTYGMGTEWSFGIPTPEEGFLAFAPGVIGINATASTSFGSKGFENRLYLETVGTAENEPVELKKKRLPAFFRADPDAEFTGQVIINASNTVNRNWNSDLPYELEVRTELPIIDNQATGFAFELTRPLDDVTSKIPMAGPKLKLLSSLGLLNFTGKIDGFVGLSADVTFRTPSPPPLPDPDTTHPEADLRATRRHMFGGTTVSATFAPQLAFGASVTTSVAGGTLEAEMGLNLTGNEKAGKPFAEIQVNPFSDWPWVKRVSGQINLDLEARINLYVWEGEKSYSWPALSFDSDRGTQSAFFLTPMTINQRRISLGDGGPRIFDGDSTQVIRNSSPLAQYALAGGTPAVLLTTDFNAATGLVELKAARRSGTGWETPQKVASAGAVTSIASLVLPDGRTLLAWGEIPAGDLGTLFPRTEIHFAVENPDGGWAAPELTASLQGVAVKLFPVMSESWSGLIIFESTEGPASALAMHGLLWGGDEFGPLQSEGTPGICLAFAALGAGEQGVILCIGEDGLTEINWDGLTFTTASRDASISQGPLAASANISGNLFRATRRNGMIVVDGFNGHTAMLETSASELALTYLPDETTPSLLLVWAEAGSLFSAFFNAENGTLLEPIEELTASSVGRYTQLSLLPAMSGGMATLLARYREGDQIGIREIELTRTGSSGLNDSDKDGLDDLAELRILDADSSDNLKTLADVLGSDDFDEDGDTNATEISQGSDPIVSSIVFDLPDSDLDIRVLVFSEDGVLTITITSFPGETYVLQSGSDVTHWETRESKKATGVLTSFNVEGPPDGASFFQIVRQ